MLLAQQGTVAAAPAPLAQQGTVAAGPPLAAQGTVAAAAPGLFEAQGTVAAAAPGTFAPTAAAAGPSSTLIGSAEAFHQQYAVHEHLGEGSFATVKRCVRKTGGEAFAAKFIDKKIAGVAELDGLLYEVEVMRGLSHPMLMRMHSAFEGADEIIIVLDLLEGQTLFDRIIDSKHYDEATAARATANMLSGLGYLHARGVMHRDLKPENLLMKRKRTHNPGQPGYMLDMTEVVIADFGLATQPPSKVVCGSPAYVAPEVLMTQTGDCSYGVSCDVWSMGVIVYIMFSGSFPFKGKTQSDTFHAIMMNPLRFQGDVWKDLSQDSAGFLEKLLDKDPDERPSAAAALRLAWVTGQQLQQPEKRQDHMEKSRHGLQRFRLREKVSCVMNVFRGARRLRLLAPGAGGAAAAKGQEGPAFLRYLKPPSDTALAIPAQSQTDPSKTHTVDLRLCSAQARRGVDFTLHSVCTCPSRKVCRHLQYVYMWLFVGDRAAEVPPHCSEMENRRRELVDQAAAFGAPTDADALAQLQAYRALAETTEFLLRARDFRAAYDAVPDADKKAILSTHFGSSAAMGSRCNTGESRESTG